MSKYYDKELPDAVHVIYGGRYYGKTYREFKKLEEENIMLRDAWKDMLDSRDKLCNRIGKAIKYIEENVAVCAFGNKELPHWEFNDDNIQDLLKILKGEEK